MYTDYTHHTKHKPYRSQRSYVNSTVLHHTDRIDHTYIHYRHDHTDQVGHVYTDKRDHIDHTIQVKQIT